MAVETQDLVVASIDGIYAFHPQIFAGYRIIITKQSETVSEREGTGS
jgi:hypothetical protein